MILPLFGNIGEGSLSGGATVEIEGRKMFWPAGQKLKALSLKYILAGTRTFSLYYRHYNGKSWLGWNKLQINDSSLTDEFSDTAAAGVILQFSLPLQSCDLDGMQGGQIKAVGVSGTADAAFYDAYGVIE